VAILALRHPKNNGATAGTQSPHPSDSVSVSASSTPRTTPASTPKSTPTSAPSTTASSAHSTSGAKSLSLIVLNNSTIHGLAASASADFTRGGWKVSSYGNYQNNIISTCAYYDPSVPGAQAEAQALQQQFPTIRRVEPRFAELPASPIVVVLTSDYQGG
jgi:hypothetical protein